MSTEPDAGETAHDDGEPTTERTETVEVELPPADVERIELEIEESSGEHTPETVGEWIASRVRIEFSRINHHADRHIATPEVEVPPLVAERAMLEHESARQRGKDSSIEEILMNEVEVHPEYRVNGYRIENDGEEVDLSEPNEE